MHHLTLCSDLHIDYNKSSDLFIQAYKDYSGYLIIAGDFAEVRHKDSIFFQTFDELFEINRRIYIIFICGNHEYYHNSIEETHELINNWIEDKDMDRFFFLNEELEMLAVEDTLFRGSTLWYPDTNPDVYLLQNNIDDFSKIKEFNPAVAAEQNRKIKESVLSRKNCSDEIWIFHHLPSYKSVNKRFRGDRSNCYFVDPDMSKIILEKQPRMVIHGHSHHPCQYQICNTWVVSNPKGYGKENEPFHWFKHMVWI